MNIIYIDKYIKKITLNGLDFIKFILIYILLTFICPKHIGNILYKQRCFKLLFFQNTCICHK